MLRCRSCNRKLSDETLKSKKMDGSYEDMCSTCKGKAFSEHNILSDREYNHGYVTGDSNSGGDSYYYEWTD